MANVGVVLVAHDHRRHDRVGATKSATRQSRSTTSGRYSPSLSSWPMPLDTASCRTGLRRWRARESSCSRSRGPAAGARASASISNTPDTECSRSSARDDAAARRQVRPHRRDRRRQARPDRRQRLHPRGRGILTAIRALLIARRSAVAERTRVLSQLQALTATAPIALRDRNLTGCCSAHRRVPSWGDNQPGGTSWIYQMVSVRFIGFGPGRVDGLLRASSDRRRVPAAELAG